MSEVEKLTADLERSRSMHAEAFRIAYGWQERRKEEGFVFSLIIAAQSRRVEELEGALLARIRQENDCRPDLERMPHCTGWDAELCGCAMEARSALLSLEAHADPPSAVTVPDAELGVGKEKS